MPLRTEVTEDFLGIIVRNSLIGSAEFLETVHKIADKDEKTIAMFSDIPSFKEKTPPTSVAPNSRYNSRNSTG